jgi:hypothetical protein
MPTNQEDAMSNSANDDKPGSNAALLRGCTCPVIDNHCGEGRPYPSGTRWIIAEGCPVHTTVRRHVARFEALRAARR